MATINIPASFYIKGETIDRLIKCVFNITDNIKTLKFKKIGYILDGGNDLTITGVVGQKGIIEEDYNGTSIPVPNTKITVFKNGYMIDSSITNSNGEYVLFLESGVYDIIIDSSNYKREIKNYEVKNGISNVFSIPVKGEIFRKYYDAVSFLNQDSSGNIFIDNNWLINGTIINPNNEPVENAQLVISQKDKVIVCVNTDNKGKYHFMLPIGIYDVRIRIPNQHVKIFRNIYFNGEGGFINQLVNN